MKQKDEVVTKSILKSEINSLREELTEEIKQSEARIKDETLTRLDKILGIVNKQDEDRVITTYRQTEQSDQLENHEQRIITLETTRTP